MSYSISTAITPAAAARLIISGEIDLTGNWTQRGAKSVLHELLAIPFCELLQIVDHSQYGAIAEAKMIPQFSKIDTLIKVPYYFSNKGCPCADYAQLGFFLKRDPDAKLAANIKFGETYGKGASLLGIVNCIDQRFCPSVLSNAFCDLDYQEQEAIICRLLFRVPIVQIILKAAANGETNGFTPMEQLKESTKHRRSQCLRNIFKLLDECGDSAVSSRINNIIWEDS